MHKSGHKSVQNLTDRQTDSWMRIQTEVLLITFRLTDINVRQFIWIRKVNKILREHKMNIRSAKTFTVLYCMVLLL